jgi:Tfp pilus assembly protein PilW
MPTLNITSTLRAEHGVSLLELLVAMSMSTIVMLALVALLLFSTGQESRISERVEADQVGRTAMARIVQELHSTCTGFSNGGIQGPSSTPTAPLAATGPLNLWFVSTYGSSTSGSAVESTAYEHDINWTSTGGKTGTLTDYSFASVNGSGPSSGSKKWEFPEPIVANAKAHVLATKVIPYEVGKAKVIFQYYTLSSTTGAFSELAESSISTEAKAGKVAKVSISFEQAPHGGSTNPDRVAPFSNSVALRLSATETGESAKDEPCA